MELENLTNGRDNGSRKENARPKTKVSFFRKHQTIINFWLDSALLVMFVFLIWVSVVVRFVFPPPQSASGYVLGGMELSGWLELQFGALCVFVLGIVTHLMLHWSWVCGVLGSRLFRHRDGSKRFMDDGQRTILGVGLMIVLLNIMGLGIAIAVLSLKPPF